LTNKQGKGEKQKRSPSLSSRESGGGRGLRGNGVEKKGSRELRGGRGGDNSFRRVELEGEERKESRF